MLKLRDAFVPMLVMMMAAFAVAEDSKQLPRVLLLGDSISIGYTPYVQKMLEGEAVVLRPMNAAKTRAENCQGTNHGVASVDRWLKIDGGNWDVIHVNFGLHDIKRVDPKSGKASANADHPRQADLETYEKQLREIVGKLVKTDAAVIVCTTTPYPAGTKPHRDPDDEKRYNAAAMKIAKEFDLQVDNLAEFARPKLDEIQRPVNVHFSPEGSQQLAGKVVEEIRKALK